MNQSRNVDQVLQHRYRTPENPMSFSIDFGSPQDKIKSKMLHKVNLRRKLKKTEMLLINNFETPHAPLNGSALELDFHPNQVDLTNGQDVEKRVFVQKPYKRSIKFEHEKKKLQNKHMIKKTSLLQITLENKNKSVLLAIGEQKKINEKINTNTKCSKEVP